MMNIVLYLRNNPGSIVLSCQAKVQTEHKISSGLANYNTT